jgi:hypothetical protein
MLFGLGTNGFIGDQCNHVRMVVTMGRIVSGVNHSGSNLVGPLAMACYHALLGQRCCTMSSTRQRKLY